MTKCLIISLISDKDSGKERKLLRLLTNDSNGVNEEIYLLCTTKQAQTEAGLSQLTTILNPNIQNKFIPPIKL